MTTVDVSVIIPTVLRPELVRAVHSARDDHLRTEVVVVVDGPEDSAVTRSIGGLVDQILFTGGGRGAAHARNIGVREARGRWIAFLDDDDEFLPGKLQAQVDACERLAATGVRPIVSCRAVYRWASPSRISKPLPSRLYQRDEPVEEYLFLNRRLGVDRASIFAPTLMVEASLAGETPWDATLERHQDWDFILRATARKGVVLEQLPVTGTVCWMGAKGAMSADANWSASLLWALRWRDVWSPAAYADFLVAQTLRYALQARSLRGCRRVFTELAMSRRVPSRQASALGLSGLVPRRHLETGAALLGGRRRSGPA